LLRRSPPSTASSTNSVDTSGLSTLKTSAAILRLAFQI
jgi:hypothetical protein